MVWSEYVNETVWEDNETYDDAEYDSDQPPSTRINCDDWTTWHSEDLLNMWFTLCNHREQAPYLWKRATYSNFCEFCYVYSYGEDEYTKKIKNTWCDLDRCSEEYHGAWNDIKGYGGFFFVDAGFQEFYNYSLKYSK